MLGKKEPTLSEKLIGAISKPEAKMGKSKKTLIGAGVVSILVGVAAAASKKETP